MKADKLLFFICLFGAIFVVLGYSYFSTCHYLGCYCEKVVEACSFEIDINISVVLVGFYGAVIAFFIPHSIEMVSKIGKQYQSESIADRFRNEKLIEKVPFHLLLGILCNFFLILFYKMNYELLRNILVFMIACHFLYVLYLIRNYINRLKFYTNTDAIITEIQQEIKDAIR